MLSKLINVDLAQMEHALAGDGANDDMLMAYGELQHRFELAGGYTYDIRGNATAVASAELYDPISGTWTASGSMTLCPG